MRSLLYILGKRRSRQSYYIIMHALFNKNKQFIGYSPDIPPSSSLLRKEIPPNQTDFTIWSWVGDYDTGKMVSIAEKGYPQEEIDIEQQLFEEINLKYPLGMQLIYIIKQLQKTTPIENMDKDFAQMAQTVLSAVEKYQQKIKYLQSTNSLVNKNETVKKFREVFGR
jgi:hypothetical protein